MNTDVKGSTPMRELLYECIRNFGAAPREFSFWNRMTYDHIPMPLWLRLNPVDKLKTLFRHSRELLRNGTVVWGHIVQANNLMFEKGLANCPGDVVYSLVDAHQTDPGYLQDVAGMLFSLKGTKPDNPELAPIANNLTNEMIRVYGLKVPAIISPEIRCMMTTVFLVRKHLPDRRLRSMFLPLIVNPKEPHVAMPLPVRYWPEELIRIWSR
jgi:hypothetical protein